MNLRKLTVINCILCLFTYIFSLTFFLCNIMRLWVAWHLVGFGLLFFIPVPIISSVVSIFYSNKCKNRKYLISNVIISGIAVLTVLLSLVFCSSW